MDERLLRALGDEVLRVSRRGALATPGARLEQSAFRILWRLAERGPLTLRELAEELQLEQSTVNRQVNTAIAHGLVERVESPRSGGRPVRPTPAGQQAYEHDGRLRGELFTRAIDELGTERAAQLVRSLRDLNDALDRVHQEARTQPR